MRDGLVGAPLGIVLLHKTQCPRAEAGARYHGGPGGAYLSAPLAQRPANHVRHALYPHGAVVWEVAGEPAHGRQLPEVAAPALFAPARKQRNGPLSPVPVGFSLVPLGRPPAGPVLPCPRLPVQVRLPGLPSPPFSINFPGSRRAPCYTANRLRTGRCGSRTLPVSC